MAGRNHGGEKMTEMVGCSMSNEANIRGKDRRRSWPSSLVVMASALMLAVPATASLEIDDFSSDQMLVLLPGEPSASGFAAAPGAIGGERDLEITRVGSVGGTADVSVNGGGQGQLLFSPGINTEAILRVVWDGEDGVADEVDATGLGAVDLSGGGTLDRFAIEFDSDLATTLSLRVYDASDPAGASWSEATMVPVVATGGEFMILEVPFAAFTEIGPTAAADFTNAGAIALEVVGVSALDLALNSVRVVPEPAAGTLVALTALALLGRRRPRRAR